ncbi:hypothetical protein [Priestia megaterium]|uniref:hypothetical protein n=1 Tax=Priestia megaterium TaxID=1404 RepID=UPI000D229A87|nr:hypothetical protein CS527_02320 [Bacillus sp. Y-01]
MLHESNKVNDIKIQDSKITFSDIYDKQYFPKEYEQDIKRANALLLPYENFRGFDKPIFPEETQKFFEYLKASEKTELTTDICISDEEYVELELHADLITLPLLILDKAVLPIVVGLITNYLTEKKIARKTEIKAKVDLTVVDGEKSKRISYEGDADKFEETLESAKHHFFDE